MGMIFTKRLLLVSLLVTTLYLLLFIYSSNFLVINNLFSLNLPVTLKLTSLLLLTTSLGTTLHHHILSIMIVNALLTGIVLAISFDKIRALKERGNIHIVVGGSSILGLVGGSCVSLSCGLSLFSILGLGGSLLYLPFKGAELPYISLLFLSISLFILIKDSQKAVVCELLKEKI